MLGRYPDPVCGALCERIAELNQCRREQVLVGNGSDELLALCIRAFVDRDAGGRVGCFNPSYSLYPVLAAIEDVPLEMVQLGADFRWNMPADYSASLFFLTHPNAPTGRAFDRRTVESFCHRFDGVVGIDEAYADFADEQYTDLGRTMDNVLILRTLSKSFSLAGLRLGYLVGPEPLVSALYKIKDSYNVSRLYTSVGVGGIK